MKSIKTLLLAAVVLSTSATAMADYNRAAISYDNTYYNFNKDLSDDDDFGGFSTNGFGLNYIHGFSLTESHPMYIEVGGNINFMFGGKTWDYIDGDKEKFQYQNVNLQIPVNYTWRFAIGDSFKISPFAGLNFKINMMSKQREGYKAEGEKWEWEDWDNCFSKDDMGEDGRYNVFQMGWQVGVNFSWNQLVLGLQYGTDFIPAYRHDFSEGGFKYTPTVNTSNFKLSLGYEF